MGHFGGADGPGDEVFGVGFPGDDIDFFALKFVDDALDAVAAEADASAYRVDALLGSLDGYLAAKAGVAGDGFDGHGAVIDFRDFDFKEAAEHIPVAAGYDDFGAFGAVADVEDIDLDALAFLVALGGDLLLGGHNGLGPPAQVEGYGAVGFDLFDDAGDDVAAVLEEFLEEEFPFGFAETLQDDLLGGLGGDAAGDVGDGAGGGDFLAEFGVIFDLAGVREGDFPVGVIDGVDHGFQGVHADFPGVGVEGYADVLAGGRVVLAESGGQSHLNGA